MHAALMDVLQRNQQTSQSVIKVLLLLSLLSEVFLLIIKMIFNFTVFSAAKNSLLFIKMIFQRFLVQPFPSSALPPSPSISLLELL